MTDNGIGTLYLVYNKIAVVSQSNDVVLYKIEEDDITGKRSWKKYQEIHIRGQLYYIKGNVRIQIVSDEKIYFFIINQETLEASLQNVMLNYMKCSQMMFGPRVKYGITYKDN